MLDEIESKTVHNDGEGDQYFFFNLNFFLLFHYPLNYKNIGKFTI